MTPLEWRNLSPAERQDMWRDLTLSERAAINAADKDTSRRVATSASESEAAEVRRKMDAVLGMRPTAKPLPSQVPSFLAPGVCTFLYVVTGIGFVFALILAFTDQTISAVVLAGSSISLWVWAQMISYIARAAHFSEQTAKLLAIQNAANGDRELRESGAAR